MNITITATPTDRPRAHAKGMPFKASANLWHGRWAACRRVLSLLGAGAVLGVSAPVASAQVYNWVPWTSTGGQTAEATDPGMGTVTLGSDKSTSVSVPFPIRFDGVSFTPVDAPSVNIGNGVMQGWTLSINFAAVPNTSGVIVGMGNFGHGTPSLPGYRLAAFDTLGLAMPLTALEQIGSYDHTWTSFGFSFNDDVALNTVSGDFVVTVVAGLNENNSDILLMSLPASVGRLEVSTVGPTAAESINVVIATALAQSNIDPAHKFAWQENCGWLNWRDAHAGSQGVRVTARFLSGFVWAENIGWINLGDGTPPDGVHYVNDLADSSTFGVNVDSETGDLFGLAWGENVGWINFDTRTALGPHLQQAQLDLCDNTLAGYAWGENIGWINLDDTTHYVALGPVCAPSDAACDGVISLFDYLEFKRVFEGPTVLVDCPVFDPDGDGDVDLRDLAKLQADFTG